uniref:Uncharacterized protein n=1 Tax=Meloidogyne hapla TaxID=6305 RepID=A0A1I8BWZ9_MELHA
MDEQRFWSSALGEWICDCVCGTSSPSSKNSDPNLCGPIISESTWRSPANFDLQLRYSELCDSIALNLLFCFLSSANDQQQSSALLLFPSFSTTYKNSFLPIEDQQLHNCDRQRHFTVERSESLSSGFSSENNNNNNNVICAGSCQSIVKRLRQFQQLLRALCLFYQSNSLLIITLPKIHCIARSPSSGKLIKIFLTTLIFKH